MAVAGGRGSRGATSDAGTLIPLSMPIVDAGRRASTSLRVISSTSCRSMSRARKVGRR